MWLILWNRRPNRASSPHPSIHRPLPSPHPHLRPGAVVREGSCLCPHGNAEFSPSFLGNLELGCGARPMFLCNRKSSEFQRLKSTHEKRTARKRKWEATQGIPRGCCWCLSPKFSAIVRRRWVPSPLRLTQRCRFLLWVLTGEEGRGSYRAPMSPQQPGKEERPP